MSQIDVWSSEAVSGHREVHSFDLPSWKSVEVLLAESGHFVNLKEPSLKHQQRIIQESIFPPITIPIFSS